MNKLGTTVDHRSTQYKTIPLNDLTVGLLKKPGMAESITINGQSVTTGGRKFLPRGRALGSGTRK